MKIFSDNHNTSVVNGMSPFCLCLFKSERSVDIKPCKKRINQDWEARKRDPYLAELIVSPLAKAYVIVIPFNGNKKYPSRLYKTTKYGRLVPYVFNSNKSESNKIKHWKEKTYKCFWTYDRECAKYVFESKSDNCEYWENHSFGFTLSEWNCEIYNKTIDKLNYFWSDIYSIGLQKLDRYRIALLLHIMERNRCRVPKSFVDNYVNVKYMFNDPRHIVLDVMLNDLLPNVSNVIFADSYLQGVVTYSEYLLHCVKRIRYLSMWDYRQIYNFKSVVEAVREKRPIPHFNDKIKEKTIENISLTRPVGYDKNKKEFLYDEGLLAPGLVGKVKKYAKEEKRCLNDKSCSVNYMDKIMYSRWNNACNYWFHAMWWWTYNCVKKGVKRDEFKIALWYEPGWGKRCLDEMEETKSNRQSLASIINDLKKGDPNEVQYAEEEFKKYALMFSHPLLCDISQDGMPEEYQVDEKHLKAKELVNAFKNNPIPYAEPFLDYYDFYDFAKKYAEKSKSTYYDAWLEKLNIVEEKVDRITEKITEGVLKLWRSVELNQAKMLVDCELHCQLNGKINKSRLTKFNQNTAYNEFIKYLNIAKDIKFDWTEGIKDSYLENVIKVSGSTITDLSTILYEFSASYAIELARPHYNLGGMAEKKVVDWIKRINKIDKWLNKKNISVVSRMTEKGAIKVISEFKRDKVNKLASLKMYVSFGLEKRILVGEVVSNKINEKTAAKVSAKIKEGLDNAILDNTSNYKITRWMAPIVAVALIGVNVGNVCKEGLNERNILEVTASGTDLVTQIAESKWLKINRYTKSVSSVFGKANAIVDFIIFFDTGIKTLGKLNDREFYLDRHKNLTDLQIFFYIQRFSPHSS